MGELKKYLLVGKRASLLCLAWGMFGCSSVMTLKAAAPVPAERCQVQVYLTRASAEENGAIEELCVIDGSSSGSFVHTAQTAIEKHKNKACACGATNVYVRSTEPMGLGPAKVSMVAFRYRQPE